MYHPHASGGKNQIMIKIILKAFLLMTFTVAAGLSSVMQLFPLGQNHYRHRRNGFVIDPSRKAVSGSICFLVSRLANPYPFFNKTLPSLITSTAAPGVSPLLQVANSASTLSAA